MSKAVLLCGPLASTGFSMHARAYMEKLLAVERIRLIDEQPSYYAIDKGWVEVVEETMVLMVRGKGRVAWKGLVARLTQAGFEEVTA